MEILAPSSPPSPQAVLSAALLKSRIVKRKRERTALEETLTEERLAWLARYAKNRYDAYYSALSTWRNDLDCYLQQSEDYFEWRRSAANRNSGPHSIFSRQNDSLNLVGAFSEFFTAHAQNDLFGSSPWFTTKPQGRADKALADHIAAHAAGQLQSPADLAQTASGLVLELQNHLAGLDGGGVPRMTAAFFKMSFSMSRWAFCLRRRRSATACALKSSLYRLRITVLNRFIPLSRGLIF